MSSVNTRKGLLGVALAGYFVAATFGAPSQAQEATNLSRTPQANAAVVSQQTNHRLPPSLEAIAWLAEANIEPGILLAFIHSSSIAYSPRPGDIVALKQRGVPDEVIVALVEHGARIRAKMEASKLARQKESEKRERRSHQSNNPPPAYNVQPPTPAPVYVPYPVPIFPFYGQVTSFNNTYPTYINGRPVYSGYYVLGYGYLQ